MQISWYLSPLCMNRVESEDHVFLKCSVGCETRILLNKCCNDIAIGANTIENFLTSRTVCKIEEITCGGLACGFSGVLLDSVEGSEWCSFQQHEAQENPVLGPWDGVFSFIWITGRLNLGVEQTFRHIVKKKSYKWLFLINSNTKKMLK